MNFQKIDVEKYLAERVADCSYHGCEGIALPLAAASAILARLTGAKVVAQELELHRADHAAMKAAGFESVGELLAAYKHSESERDELKSKLSQFEREIPKTPDGFPELDKDHLIKICIHQQSKLAELESQKPAKEKSRTYDSSQCCDVVVIEVPVGFPIYASPIPPQPIASNSEPAQRITEQDAREIITAHCNYLDDSNDPIPDFEWFAPNWQKSMRTLLAKLNEHREPVTPNKMQPVQVSEPVGINEDIREAIELIYDTCKHVSDLGMFPSDNKELLNLRQIKKISSKLLSLQVIPNKTEVPDSVKWALHWLKASLECKEFLWDGDQYEAALNELNDAQKWIDSLPPLKDESL